MTTEEEKEETTTAAVEEESKKEEEEVDEGYIKTTTHNYVSRQAKIEGAKQVELKGRSILQKNVTVRGDLAIIRIGRYCEVDENSIIEPSKMNPSSTKKEEYIPIVIGSHTHIGKNCIINAAAIGSMVYISDNVTLGKRCIIKDNCIIESNVQLGDDTIIPPFTRICSSSSSSSSSTTTTTTKNNNDSYYKELPPAIAIQLQELSLDRFQEFKLQDKKLTQ